MVKNSSETTRHEDAKKTKIETLMSFSEMLEIPRLQAKTRIVMPAKAGVHLRFSWKGEENLDSFLRRNDERKSRLQSTNSVATRLIAEGV
jgi:hypothetical protein